MSRVGDREMGPQIYNYVGNANRDTYIARVVQQSSQPNPQVVSVFKTSNVQPVITSHPVQTVQPIHQTSQFRTSNRVEPVIESKQIRYTNYHHNEYRYNLFSLIDEPWNRCLQLGKCGSCPGNECIARQVRRQGWNWI